ncbi:MAG: M61 family peptidase [Phycisphaerales bacterium]|nr:MAG: M61 family peptidase [Phycisphaerales bacterium]
MTPTPASWRAGALGTIAALTLGACAEAGAGAGERDIRLRVDATDIERRLVHSRIDLPAAPGPNELYFVEWTPGNHNPSGPIQNVVNVRFFDDHGRELDWRRDPAHVVRFTVDVPEGARALTAHLSYIANQPGVNSRSTDTYGAPEYGGLNWNTVLLYPAGEHREDIRFSASLRLPEGWRAATPLPVASEDADGVRFETVSLARLIGSPVIFGSTLRSQEIEAEHIDGRTAPHVVHSVAPSHDLTELPATRLEKFARMVEETQAVFGAFPRDRYDFLVILSDEWPGFGVEHEDSTFIGMSARSFVNAETARGGPMLVVPHEYIHTWCGKLRAPEGLLADDYHTPAAPDLMWVYEGLTSYYTDVIGVRSGLLDREEYTERLASRIGGYELQKGRAWRSVLDTAHALRHLRAPSDAWEDLRRRQDYYAEGAMFWLEADALIRRGTGGERSLDDFCAVFFDVEPGPAGRPSTYTREEVIDTLARVYPGVDWDALVRVRLETPQRESLAFDSPALLGHRFEWSGEPTARQRSAEERAGNANLRSSPGFAADARGRITSVVPGSPADDARLAYGMRIVGVNDRTYSAATLRDAVRASVETGRIDLTVEWGDRLRSVRIESDQGLRYPRLIRDSSLGPDLLEGILAPRVP